MLRLDQFILDHIFTPLAHWIDCWLHVNTYRVAAVLLRYDCLCVISLAGLRMIRHKAIWADYTFPIIAFLVCWILSCALMRAARAYERRPTAIPAEVASFCRPSCTRVGFTLFFLVVIPMDIPDILKISEPLILRLVEIALDFGSVMYFPASYFAGVTLPSSPRRQLSLNPMRLARG